MAILVAGVGYIGSRLVRDLLDGGAEVVGVDNCFSTDPRAIARLCEHPRFRFVRGSATRASVLKQAFDSFPHIDTVFDLVAQASPYAATALPRYTENTNLLSPRLLLDAMVQYGARTLVFGSSFKVYGEDLPPVVDDDTPMGRFSDLSHLSKCYVEKLLEMYSWQHGLRAFAVRLGIVYGLSPIMKRDYHFMTAPNKFCLQAARQERILIHGSGLKPTGFIHVADASRAMQEVAGGDTYQGYATFNVVSEVTPVSAVAEMVMEEGSRRGLDVQVEKKGEEVTDSNPVVRSRLDQSGFRAERNLQDGIRETLDYFLGDT